MTRTNVILAASVWLLGLSAVPPFVSPAGVAQTLLTPSFPFAVFGVAALFVQYLAIPVAFGIAMRGTGGMPSVVTAYVLGFVSCISSLVLGLFSSPDRFALIALFLLASGGIAAALLRRARRELWLWAVPALAVALWSLASVPAMLYGATSLAFGAPWRILITDKQGDYRSDFSLWDLRGLVLFAPYNNSSTIYWPHHAVLVIGSDPVAYYWSKTQMSWQTLYGGHVRDEAELVDWRAALDAQAEAAARSVPDP
ncbi:hypothetical protein [Pararhodobacter zhoushanensis]|uniref:Uncharacterized protein n=1 Tax=Pararhodobacter zhoushanensis TaxID=2479545 RepID=A0ABT3GWE7_9RHOB|nr:hypothetical protein [Pararhodobacter zhoushanensis]MCW1931852.1 hypothetical protein [Pararhodobacter zhoushanensis]